MAITEKNGLNYTDMDRYMALKLRELHEPDFFKNQEVSREARIVETEKNQLRHKENELDDMFENNSISNDETVEITGGKIK